MASVLKNEREEKISKIVGIIHKLYCFTSAEIDEYLARVKDFPDEGLDRMVSLLEQGKKQQDELISHRVAEDKYYVINTGRFLKNTSAKIKNEWESSEQSKAEDILKDI